MCCLVPILSNFTIFDLVQITFVFFFSHRALKRSSFSKYKRFAYEANGFDIFIVINTISGAYGVPQIQIQGQWNAVGEPRHECIIENSFFFFLLFCSSSLTLISVSPGNRNKLQLCAKCARRRCILGEKQHTRTIFRRVFFFSFFTSLRHSFIRLMSSENFTANWEGYAKQFGLCFVEQLCMIW